VGLRDVFNEKVESWTAVIDNPWDVLDIFKSVVCEEEDAVRHREGFYTPRGRAVLEIRWSRVVLKVLRSWT
jgi:hypothetical protein